MPRWLAGAGLLLAIGFTLWSSEPDTGAGDAERKPGGSIATVTAPGDARRDASVPPTLRGTTPSGGLSVDADGHFAPDPDAVLFFEHFLSASRDEPVDELLERIRSAVRARLDPPADAEALDFLDDYLAYLELGSSEFREPRVAEGIALERRFQWLRELRREHFGAELAETLFGEAEEASRVQLAMRRVREDPLLDERQRASQLLALEAELPDRIRHARARAVAPVRLARDEERLRDAGASEAEIDALRVEQFGVDAARRLGERDRERAEWDARWARYREERAALRRPTEGAGAEARVAELRTAHFQPDELERVRLLDQIEARRELGSAPPE